MEGIMVKRIIDIINSFQGGYSGYQVFADWVKACAISISNSTELCLSSVWKERENQYMELLGKYGAEGMDKFADMLVKGGLNATVRRTLGADINAACGQLRREYEI